jgi:CBS domain-containing protein
VSTATVRDAMHPGIVSCAADTGAAEIARIMSGRGVHSVAVIGAAKDESGPPRVWGIVSDLDVLAAITAPRPYPTAADLATQPVITVRPDLPLSEAVEAMVRYGAHHVVVAEPDTLLYVTTTPLGSRAATRELNVAEESSLVMLLGTELDACGAGATVGRVGELDVEHVYGSPADRLAEFSRDVDLLVCGSRHHRPLRRLTEGSTSDHLARHAAAPLLVTPAVDPETVARWRASRQAAPA